MRAIISLTALLLIFVKNERALKTMSHSPYKFQYMGKLDDRFMENFSHRYCVSGSIQTGICCRGYTGAPRKN